MCGTVLPDASSVDINKCSFHNAGAVAPGRKTFRGGSGLFK